MNLFTKKTAFGAISVAAAGLIVAGAAAPAMATSSDTSTSTSTKTSSSERASTSNLLNDLLGGNSSSSFGLTGGDTSNTSPFILAPTTDTTTNPDTNVGDILDGGILGGDIIGGDVIGGDALSGDVLSGNATASGNEVNAPVTAPVASGNDIAAPVASGNDIAAPVDVAAPVASGNESNVGNGNTSSNDIGADTDAMVNDILQSVNLGGLLGR